MRYARYLASISLLVTGCAANGEDAPSTTASPAAQKASMSLSDLSLTQLDGTPLATEAIAGKTVLFVNVASRCGYTRQYEGLQALYEQRKDDDFVIVGVPCNQFGGQEPGSAEEIATFCRTTYGVEFPMLAKQEVNGAGRSPLYNWLVNSPAGGGADIGWNFEKFVVSPSGEVVGRFGSSTTPSSAELAAAIDAAG